MTKNGYGRQRALQMAGLLLRLVIVPVLAIWLIAQLVTLGDKRDWSSVDIPKLVLGIALYHIGLALFAERMRTTLTLFDIRIPRMASFRIYLQSIVYFFLVPMSVGIEISRYLKIKALQPDLEFKWLAPAVFMDRLIGFASSVLFALVLGALIFPVSFDQFIPAVAGGVVLALAIAAVVYAIRRYSAWLTEILRAVFRHPGRTALAIIISIAMQFVAGLGIFLCAASLGINVDIPKIQLGFSVSSIANVIPFSLFGAGPSEAAGVMAFLSSGVESRDAAIIVAIMYALKLIAALEGAAIEFYRGGTEALRFRQK